MKSEEIRKYMTLNNRFTAAPVLLFALTVAVSSLGFLLGGHTVVVSLLAAAAVIIILGVKFDRTLIFALAVTALSVVISAVISGLVYDISYDGMYFHKEAVWAIANGWNPFYEPLSGFDRLASVQELSLWLDNYPKGVWSFYACIYALCGKIECAKGANIIFVLMLFFSAYDTVKTVFEKRGITCLLLALVFTANPVIASQYFTFMNDLPTAAVIMVCAFLGMKIFSDKADNWDYICLAAVFSSSFAIKFTAPVLCGFTLASFGIAYGIKTRGRKLLKPCVIVVTAAALGFFVMGADPYVKHIENGQHIFHPVMGEDKCDIMGANAPEEINNMSNVGALLTSLFSKSTHSPLEPPELKIPFTFTLDEAMAMGVPDVRMGGFGVLFSGILLVSIALGLIALFKAKSAASVIPAIAVFILLAIFFPESWWARYSPYVYYIPCLLLLAFSCVDGVKPCAAAVSVVMLLNSAVGFVGVPTYFYMTTVGLEEKMTEIRESGQRVLLNINDFPCHAIWFDEHNIDYELIYDGEGIEWQDFYETTRYHFD